MKHFDLFPSRIWKTKISPDSYNKKEIIETVGRNYEIDPKRNNYNHDSNLHAYYLDWDNPFFEKIDFESLGWVYNGIIQKWVDSLKMKPVDIRFDIVNINAMKYGQFMSEHDHMDPNTNMNYRCAYSCVHYIKYDKSQPKTKFINPTIFSQYLMTSSHLSGLVDESYAENSVYLKDWWLDTEEDEFVIFPSYLKHKVDFEDDKPYDGLRITSVVNISLKPKNEAEVY